MLSALLAGACRTDRAVAPYPESDPVAKVDTSVAPEDLVQIRVVGQDDLSGSYTVAPDGTINFPYLGPIAISGLQSHEIEQLLEDRLRGDYLVDPRVVVQIENRSKAVTVIGQVREPGTFPYTMNMSIVDAIAKAGGFGAMAKKNAVKVTRMADGGRAIYVAVDDIGRGKAPNFTLRPGDIVFVDERVW